MHTMLTFVLLGVALVGFTSAGMPIPNRPDGYGVGGPADAHVAIDMFLDTLCPDCKATWPTVLQVIQYYGTKIHFRIHTFPLPYHTNAFVASQGVHVIANVTNRSLDSIFQYTTKVFQNQEMWYNDATKNMSMVQVVDSLATFVAQQGLVTKDQFLQGMANTDIIYDACVSWTYGCSRGVLATPTFFINGVTVSADASWSLDDWKSVIDPILASKGIETSKVQTCPQGEVECVVNPHKTECCLPGENCIPNVGCRCFTLKLGGRCL